MKCFAGLKLFSSAAVAHEGSYFLGLAPSDVWLEDYGLRSHWDFKGPLPLLRGVWVFGRYCGAVKFRFVDRMVQVLPLYPLYFIMWPSDATP